MPVFSEPVVAALIAIAGILITILAGVLSWMILKILNLRSDLDTLTESYGGSEFSEGHLQETRRSFERMGQRLDDIEDSLSYFERNRKESHQELCGKIDSIVSVLQEEDINGDLPESSDD